MQFSLPARDNKKLARLLEVIGDDQELLQLWKCANINAIDRGGLSDHGEIHVQIVANAALRILRLLIKAGVEPSIVTHHGMTNDDAELVVSLAACVHDLGIAIHREDHERFSLVFAYPKVRQLLSQVYEEPSLSIMTAEVLHVSLAHRSDIHCLTYEAGVLKVADALDMSRGRSSISYDAGEVNIHSLSVQAVEDVNIKKGDELPVRIEIILANSAGFFQVDELLKKKLRLSSIKPYVEVFVCIEGETEKKLLTDYTM